MSRRISLGDVDELTARVLARVLTDEYRRLRAWQTHPHASQVERDQADEQRLVVGMIIERIDPLHAIALARERVDGSRCKWCGGAHQRVPEDLCPMGRIEYDAAGELQALIAGPVKP